MDNCSIHKLDAVRNTITTAGHVIKFLLPYSPHLNPIEERFSKLKICIKTENVSELKSAIERGGNAISAGDCETFFNDTRRYALKAMRSEEL
jgi:transposase